MEPLFDRNDEDSVAKGAFELLAKLGDFRITVANSRTTPEKRTEAYDELMRDMGGWLSESHGPIEDYINAINEVIESIDNIHVPTVEADKYNRFRVHLDFLRQKALVARNQALDLYNGVRTAYDELQELEKPGENKKIEGSLAGYVIQHTQHSFGYGHNSNPESRANRR